MIEIVIGVTQCLKVSSRDFGQITKASTGRDDNIVQRMARQTPCRRFKLREELKQGALSGSLGAER